MMCGIVRSGICRFTELAPGQFGLTKQLVLKVALPHISLFLMAIGYAMLGSWIMALINYNDRQSSKEVTLKITREKTNFSRRLLTAIYQQKSLTTISSLENGQIQYISASYLSVNDWDQLFLPFAEHFYDIYLTYPHFSLMSATQNVSTNPPIVTISWNLFFAVTCVTSIGYGTDAPNSYIGRMFCIVFIAFGIPLYLVTLADLAKFCTEGMNRFWMECVKVRYQFSDWLNHQRRKSRYYGAYSRHYTALANTDVSDEPLRPREGRNVNWKDSIDDAGDKKISSLESSVDAEEDEGGSVKNVEQVIIAGGEEEVAEFLWTHLERAHFVDVPFLLVYVILVVYIVAASQLIAYLEGWPIWDGFYFVVMSVLTVGFGDIMPTNDRYILVIMVIILIGLIVTTTCVDIVGAYYINQLHFFGRRLDIENPLEWLRLVQRKRIEAMKRDAMRKLFETVSALHRMYLPTPNTFNSTKVVHDVKLFEAPKPPRGIVAFHATAESVALRWDPPIINTSTFSDEMKRFWYTLSYKTRTPQKRDYYTVIDFINRNHYEVTGLKSFTLYEFSVVSTSRYGSSRPVRCQEYTEPCTVPQLIKLEAISSETATISWQTPQKNNGPEQYIFVYAQEPAPPFRYWFRYNVGGRKKFTITQLNPDTKYIACVMAEHNYGLAAMSKSLRFKTRSWWYNVDEDEEGDLFEDCEPSTNISEYLHPHHHLRVQPSKSQPLANQNPPPRPSAARHDNVNCQRSYCNVSTQSSYYRVRRRSTKELTLFLAPPPSWRSSKRAKASSGMGENDYGDNMQADANCTIDVNIMRGYESSVSSITSLDYQID